MTTYRTRPEIAGAILAAANRPTKKTHIMYRARLNHQQVEEYLRRLVASGLVRHDAAQQRWIQRLESTASTPKPVTTVIVRRPKGFGELPLNDYVVLLEQWYVIHVKERRHLMAEITQLKTRSNELTTRFLNLEEQNAQQTKQIARLERYCQDRVDLP